jgi:hypothetical protein
LQRSESHNIFKHSFASLQPNIRRTFPGGGGGKQLWGKQFSGKQLSQGGGGSSDEESDDDERLNHNEDDETPQSGGKQLRGPGGKYLVPG